MFQKQNLPYVIHRHNVTLKISLVLTNTCIGMDKLYVMTTPVTTVTLHPSLYLTPTLLTIYPHYILHYILHQHYRGKGHIIIHIILLYYPSHTSMLKRLSRDFPHSISSGLFMLLESYETL